MTGDGPKVAQITLRCASLISFRTVGIRCLLNVLRKLDESLFMPSLADIMPEAGLNEY